MERKIMTAVAIVAVLLGATGLSFSQTVVGST